MRISGIASGFDTDAMVKSMMAVERMKVDRFEKSKQTALWRQESYNTMNKAFANFILNTQKDMGLKRTSSTGLITNSNYKSADYVKKATSSNESAATVTSSSSAVNGSYKLDIEKLAEGASFTSKDMRDVNKNERKFGTELKLNINGEPIDVKPSSTGKEITMDDVVKAINSATKQDEKDPKKQISLGVSAFYDKENGRLFMQTKETGTKAEISISGDFEIELGLPIVEGVDNDAKYSKGEDAKIKFNDITLYYSSNNININGLDIELKGVTSTNPISINVSTNTQGIMDKVQKLVNDYNDLIDLAALTVNEKAYPGYQPLTSEERKAMSDEDVKLWDEKAKSGLLNRDETIQRTLQSIRNDLYKTVEGLDGFDHITKIGITTEKYSRGSAGGKLVIDTEKLKNAIEENPDAVMDLLFKEGKFENGKEVLGDAKNTTKGIFTNIYDNLIVGMQAIIDKSGPGQDSDLLRGVKSNILIDFVTKKSSISDIDKSVQEMNRQMDNLNILLAKKEDSYYAKFTAMEKAMHKMNGQSGWLAQQFG